MFTQISNGKIMPFYVEKVKGHCDIIMFYRLTFVVITYLQNRIRDCDFVKP